MDYSTYTAQNSMFVPGLDGKPKLDVMLLVQNLLVLTSIIFLYWLIDAQAMRLNASPIGIFRPGGILLTFFLLAAIGMLWRTVAQLFEHYPNVRKFLKWGIFLLFVFLAVGAYFFPQPFVTAYYSPALQQHIDRLEPVRYIYGYHAQIPKDTLTPSSTTASVSDKYKLTAQEITVKLHDAVNFERRKLGLNALIYDTRLASIAEAHSNDMLARHYFDHVSPEGNTFISRYERAGYTCELIVGNETIRGGENLAESVTYNSTYANGLISDYKSVEEIVNQTIGIWMNSTSHRSNILHPYWRGEGIGVAIEPDGKILITENFC
ncbi:MAG: CAP domain-containing protein [Candidatus Iainarchaeum archaeon]|uniref:CAP domain-containing protein n=1 Tax=Candidatus Iainarchaeum sp. TaxID=3101447 RepID=A0A7T9I0Q2_9ARCH|nr:MAG: CAP domain-containing protein [Candidatus Diapherotrites archaeon]